MTNKAKAKEIKTNKGYEQGDKQMNKSFVSEKSDHMQVLLYYVIFNNTS